MTLTNKQKDLRFKLWHAYNAHRQSYENRSSMDKLMDALDAHEAQHGPSTLGALIRPLAQAARDGVEKSHDHLEALAPHQDLDERISNFKREFGVSIHE